MGGSSRQHRGEKRRKELARKAKQEEKRQRRTEKKPDEAGAGPPIDWSEAVHAEGGEPNAAPSSGDPQEGNPS